MLLFSIVIVMVLAVTTFAHGQATTATAPSASTASDQAVVVRTDFVNVVRQHYMKDGRRNFTEDGYKYVFSDLPSSQFLSARPKQYRVTVTSRDRKRGMFLTLIDDKSTGNITITVLNFSR
jgi:hypothetical protein